MAKLKQNPQGQDFTFYSCKGDIENKNADQREKKKKKEQLCQRVLLKVLPHEPAMQFNPDEEVSYDTLCFASVGSYGQILG